MTSVWGYWTGLRRWSLNFPQTPGARPLIPRASRAALAWLRASRRAALSRAPGLIHFPQAPGANSVRLAYAPHGAARGCVLRTCGPALFMADTSSATVRAMRRRSTRKVVRAGYRRYGSQCLAAGPSLTQRTVASAARVAHMIYRSIHIGFDRSFPNAIARGRQARPGRARWRRCDIVFRPYGQHVSPRTADCGADDAAGSVQGSGQTGICETIA